MKANLGSLGLALVLLLTVSEARAHKPSDSYLTLQSSTQSLSGSWDIALVDLDQALGLDTSGDGLLTWGELRGREHELARYAAERLTVRDDAGACTLELATMGVVEHSDGAYARLPLHARCKGKESTRTLRYALFFDFDPQHRGLVQLAGTQAATDLHVLTPSEPTLPLSPFLERSPQAGAIAMFRQGVTHILEGLDHLLFLLALLLPAVLKHPAGERVPAPGIRGVLSDVVKVVTAFTVAHSLTLALSALSLVSLSASLVEPAIAASVALAALNNLKPVFHADRWAVAFALGLLHGFGFSSVLSDAGVAGAQLVRALFAFNLGVEAGQLGIVLLFVPLALVLRRREGLRFFVLRCASLAIFATSLFWFFERLGKGA